MMKPQAWHAGSRQIRERLPIAAERQVHSRGLPIARSPALCSWVAGLFLCHLFTVAAGAIAVARTWRTPPSQPRASPRRREAVVRFLASEGFLMLG
jgi:hypothetical protein